MITRINDGRVNATCINASQSARDVQLDRGAAFTNKTPEGWRIKGFELKQKGCLLCKHCEQTRSAMITYQHCAQLL